MIFATLVGIVRGSHVILWLWLLGGMELLWGRERGEIDSLEALLRARKVSDTTLLSVYTSLAKLYLSVEPAKALSYARQLSEKASKNNDLRRQVLGWYYQAAAHYELRRYEESERTLVRAESLFQYMRPDTGILVQFKSLKAAIFESRREEVPKVLSAYQEALDLARASGQPRLRVMALNNLAEFYLNQGLYEAAQPLLEEALQLGQAGQEADHLYNTYLTLARYYQRQGKVDSALLVLHQVRQLGERTGVRRWVRESYSRSVQVVLEEGHIEKVDTLLRQGEAALRTDSLLLAEFLNQAASDLYVKGALNQAKTLWEKALQIAEAAPYPVVGIRVLMNLGSLYERQADYPKALEKFLQARSLCDKHQDTVRLPMVLMNIGNVYFAQEQYPKALEAYSEAARYAYLAENRDFPARVAANLAVSYAKLGDYETARRLLEESSLLADAEENWSAATTALINLTWIDIERGAYKEALKDLEKAAKYAQKSKDPYLQAQIYLTQAHIYYQQKAYTSAIRAYEAARPILEGQSAYSELAEVYEKLSELYAQVGQYQKAYQAAQQLAAVIRRLSNEENTRALTRLEMNYLFEKERERQTQLLREEQIRSEKARQLTLVILVGSVLVLGAMLFGIFTLYRANKKEKEANAELARRNALIEEQKRLLEEKNEALERAKRDIEESIQYARRIQVAILPDLSELYMRLPESFVLYLPRDVVSGDFYYFYPISDQVSVVAVADCTGHGVPGAFMSMIGSTLLNKLSQEEGIKDAATYLERLDEELRATIHNTMGESKVKDGMDIGLCLIDHSQHYMHFAGAKRPLYLFRPDGTFIEIKGTRRSIGGDNLADQMPFENHEIRLEEGMSFYLFSDGIVDQFGWEHEPGKPPRRTKFMPRRFRELLEKIRTLPAAEQKERIEMAIMDWRRDIEQIDDICVIGVRYSSS
jgi:serine phosphatase RsbU (regulator of sigma subunit)/uncharacterized protein HemY